LLAHLRSSKRRGWLPNYAVPESAAVQKVIRVEGRKPLAETHPEAVALAKRLRRASPKTGERGSLRKISAELAAVGLLSATGKPFSAKSVLAMIEGPNPTKTGRA
jgi:hypothetical protein